MKVNSLKFATLQAEWYRRLAEDGFRDLEVGTGELLTGSVRSYPDATRTKYATPGVFEANLEYYLAAGRLAHTHCFASDLERVIWELHADGVPHRTIARETGASYHTVRVTIARLAAGILRAARDTSTTRDAG